MTLGLVASSATGLAFWLSCLLFGLLFLPLDLRQQLLLRMSRLRWFFLAIFVLYLFGQPGGGVLVGDWSGLYEASYRLALLLMMVAAVTLCLHGLSAAELADASARLLGAFAFLGFDIASFARRLAGSLDAVAHMDDLLRELRDKNKGQGMDAWLQALAELFWRAENHQFHAELEQPLVACSRLHLLWPGGILLLAVMNYWMFPA